MLHTRSCKIIIWLSMDF